MQQLEGLITEDTGEILRRLASEVPAGQAIVEIGSYKGKSTCYLASGAVLNGLKRVYAVDPWELGVNGDRFGFNKFSTHEEFRLQVKLAGYGPVVTELQGFSVDIANQWGFEPIGLLFIDGDHEEQSVLDDFYAWEPHLAEDAIVVFDDYMSERSTGVRAAVDRLFGEDRVQVEGSWLAVVKMES